ncbi:ComEC/Rec2 family competence protein [Dictyobacter aurantiacus]|uniref:DNA internalization-related competence protein ComEC/Rec2 n=1 Tax=Dictyobacter aurantiacus TaxID=1936993 RepID=A0A401ZAG9_9CHLR|nr:ComEC/Rec2 family competence protein [Dictyobacter aurantiacus]GCE03849.1 DNA internalization-related competence protein ComEC/Rec2 [Dictyobacter aurantiacus]
MGEIRPGPAPVPRFALPGLPVVVSAIGWLTGILLATWFAASFPFLLLFAAIGVLLALIYYWRTPTLRQPLLALLFLILGAWRYTGVLPGNDPLSIAHQISSRAVKVQGTVSDEPRLEGRTRLLKVAVEGIVTPGSTGWQTVHGTIEVQISGTSIEDVYGANYGDQLMLQGKLGAPPPHGPADVLAQMAFPRLTITGHGGNPLVAWLYHWRVQFMTLIEQSLPQPYAALLIAIVLGLRTPQLGSLSQAFNVTGTAHLIVPSGFKVTLTAGLVASCTRWFYEGWLATKLGGSRVRGWQRWLGTLIVLLCIAAYTVLSGAGSAAIRSGVMGGLLVLAPRLGRTYNIYTALAFTAMGMSLLDPLVLWDTGFQLSFLGTLGIVLFTPHIQRPLHPLTRLPGGHFLVETCAVTLAAQLATLPIFALTFQQISFIAPIANMLTVPLLGIIITLGLLLCALGLISALAATICGWLVWPLLWYMSQSILICAALPGAYLSVTTLDSRLAWLYYLPLSLWLLFLLKRQSSYPASEKPHVPGKSRSKWGQRLLYGGIAITIIVATAIASLRSQATGTTIIDFLRVGPTGKPAQGEAIFIRTADAKTILIDGGLDVPSLSQALDSRLPSWQRFLDLVILTVPRTDHLLGLQDVVTRYRVGAVVDGGMLHPSATYARWRQTIQEQRLPYQSLARGNVLTIGEYTSLQIMWPGAQLHPSKSIQDNTLVIRLVAPGIQLLLLGTAAQSQYALSQLSNQTTSGALGADIVQIVGDGQQPVRKELGPLIQQAHPSLLIETPPATQKKGHATGVTAIKLPETLSHMHTVNVGTAGTIEVTGDAQGWKVAPP